jgi:hypothetical protein
VRLKEGNALQLQPRTLSDVGRIGLLSKMPLTFPVEVIMHRGTNKWASSPLSSSRFSKPARVPPWPNEIKLEGNRTVLTEGENP